VNRGFDRLDDKLTLYKKPCVLSNYTSQGSQ